MPTSGCFRLCSYWSGSRTAVKNRPNQEILICDWLITSHVTQTAGSDWVVTYQGDIDEEVLEEIPHVVTRVDLLHLHLKHTIGGIWSELELCLG